MDHLFRQQIEFSDERSSKLNVLGEYVASRLAAGKPVQLTFICTHNSRRSHLAQVWAQVAAQAFGLKEVTTFSAGTEVTAMNTRALGALERTGFFVHSPEGKNPRYEVRAGADLPVQHCFSKLFDDPYNPQNDFGAVMTCADAESSCPAMADATIISLPYDDPQLADDTPEEADSYDECSDQVAAEMFFVMSRVRQRIGA